MRSRGVCIKRTAQNVILLSVFCVSSVSAWFFTPQPEIAKANGKAVDDECIAHGEVGRCEFYTCFEQRLPCGADGYLKKFGQPYCGRFQRSLDDFTEEGKVFVNGSSRCLTKALLPYYRQPQVDCHELSHAAFDAMSSCYVNNDFCDILPTNVAVLADIYQPKHLFQEGALKIWREILEVTYRCDPERYHSFVKSMLSVLSNVFSYLGSL